MLEGKSTAGGSASVSGSSATIFDYMRLRAAECRYLDRENEWKIIDNAIFQLGLRPVDAKSYLVGAAICDGFSTESIVKRTLADIARGLRKNSESISKDEFEFMVGAARGLANNEISKEDAENLVKQACEIASLKARRRGLLRSRQWYRGSGSSKNPANASVKGE
ncbi:MAG TPA: hypothetical protein VKA94_09640 [Hyphomicrobiales bacterium]|nr:hypothetical protein [Hyphomicrobiales bacterium]